MKIRRNYLILLLSAGFFLNGDAQAYQMGDISLSVNYGAPQITPAVIRFVVDKWYNSKFGDKSYVISVKSTGVLNAKLDYGFHEELSLGLVTSYWKMDIDVDRNYNSNHPTTGENKNFTDSYHYDLSALAIGLRGNYHFFTEKQLKVWDPYTGLSFGLTRYSNNLSFSTDYPNKLIPPEYKWNYRSGWAGYFSTTLGLKIYPVPFFAFNLEVGWDRGAFTFAGVVFKIHTKPPAFLTKDD